MWILLVAQGTWFICCCSRLAKKFTLLIGIGAQVKSATSRKSVSIILYSIQQTKMRWVEPKKKKTRRRRTTSNKANETRKKRKIRENRIARIEKKRAVKVNHYASSIFSLGILTDCFAVRVEHFFFLLARSHLISMLIVSPSHEFGLALLFFPPFVSIWRFKDLSIRVQGLCTHTQRIGSEPKRKY